MRTLSVAHDPKGTMIGILTPGYEYIYSMRDAHKIADGLDAVAGGASGFFADGCVFPTAGKVAITDKPGTEYEIQGKTVVDHDMVYLTTPREARVIAEAFRKIALSFGVKP